MFVAIAIGALLGFYIGHGVVGGVLGGALGWWLGNRLRTGSHLGGIGGAIHAIRKQFLESTFAVMGAVCKADGQVTREEIQAAETLFDRLHLGAEQRSQAKAAFNRGKAPDFDLDAEVASFARIARGQHALLQMFLQVQLVAIGADGAVHPTEHDMLVRIARGLGLDEAEVQRLEAMLRGGATAGGAGASSADKLDNAYQVLGVGPQASDAQVKKAYRKLMSDNHPDKLAAKGLPESMREMAEEKTREISNAYDVVKAARDMV